MIRTLAVAALAAASSVAVGCARICSDGNAYELTDHGLYIHGRVVDSTGKPVASGMVYGSAEGWEQGPVVQGPTGADGSFALGPLRRGRCSVLASDMGPSAAHALVEAGASDVVLTVQPRARVSGRVLMPSGEPSENAPVFISWNENGAPNRSTFLGYSMGTFSEFAQPGDCCLISITDDGLASQPVVLTLAPGEERTGVELELAPAARLKLEYDGVAFRAAYRVFVAGRLVDWNDFDDGHDSAKVVVPPGELTVELRRWTGDHHDPEELPALKQLVRVAAGETKTLVFTDG